MDAAPDGTRTGISSDPTDVHEEPDHFLLNVECPLTHTKVFLPSAVCVIKERLAPEEQRDSSWTPLSADGS